MIRIAGGAALGMALACGGAVPAPSPQPKPAPTWTIADDWALLTELGCREEGFSSMGQPWPPEAARLVRNTPYALRGRWFEAPELRAFFEKQPWYHAVEHAPEPSPEEVACARRIDAWETKERARLNIPRDLEDRLIREGYYEKFLRAREPWPWPPPGERFELDGDLWWCERGSTPREDGDQPCREGLHCPAHDDCTPF